MLSDLILRPLTRSDAPLLAEATLGNVNFDADRLTMAAVAANARLSGYFTAFPGPADYGYAAEVAGAHAGVVWVRLFPPSTPGYGFVAPDVPELSVHVQALLRGRGVGSALLAQAVHGARERGFRGLSLSVQDGNRAKKLYLRHGFAVAARDGTADTMLLTLG